jgi:transcriptional regulator with XRE-family HTH domain
MTALYAGRTVVVKLFRTLGAVPINLGGVHDAYMGKKTTRTAPTTRLRPLYQRTFIRAWREKRKMSQEELAAKVGEYLEENEISEKGYSYASIGRIENGRMPYSQPIIEGIAKALRVPVATLIALPPPADDTEPPLNQEALMALWNNVSRTVGRRE